MNLYFSTLIQHILLYIFAMAASLAAGEGGFSGCVLGSKSDLCRGHNGGGQWAQAGLLPESLTELVSAIKPSLR